VKRLLVHDLQLTSGRAVACPSGQKHLGQPVVLSWNSHPTTISREAA
jgi:hypothetical protein